MALNPERVAELIQQTAFTKRRLISLLFANALDWIVNELNNRFHSGISMSSSGISFTDNNGAGDTIIDSASGFSFSNNQIVDISGSKYNDGVYSVVTSEAGTLTLHDGTSLVTEAAGSTVTITAVNIPKGMEMPLSKLIKFDMAKRDPSIRSRSLADFSESYAGDGNYPPALMEAFQDWRNEKIIAKSFQTENSSDADVTTSPVPNLTDPI